MTHPLLRSAFPRSSAPFAALLAAVACSSRPAARASTPDSPEACAARQRDLVGALQKLPERPVAASLRVDLPESTLGAVPGSGPVLEIGPGAVFLDGEPLRERGAERARRIEHWLQGWAPAGAAQKAVLYVAASADTDVQTLRAELALVPPGVDLRLLVRTRAATPIAESTSREAEDLAARLLAERDAEKREELAEAGYAKYARCGELESAVRGVRGRSAEQRWPALRTALLEALPRCECSTLDAPALAQLIVAEQRAGASSLGSVPLAFVRDVRCGASMPLRGVGKLVRQMESFDAEFSGGWERDALHFDEVLGNDRLLGYFCNALPGETLAAQQRARATLYWRAPGGECHAWRFEPLAPGAPMGTWRRVAPSGEPLAFHYWQAAEEIRLFGPVPSATSKPTDETDWSCRQNYRLTGVDADAIQTETGSWFFSEDACRRGTTQAAQAAGCVSALSFGAPAAAPQPN